MRAVAAAAGLSPSMIYYHFGDVERLYLAAQKEALAAAREWCDAQSRLLDDLETVMPPQALGPVLAQMIDSLCTEQRGLALAWRECQIQAARAPAFRAPREAWAALWETFWREVCARFALEHAADMVHYFFEGESFLHLMRWNRAADRASLDETANGWIGWLTGNQRPPAPWRRTLLDRARRSSGSRAEPGTTARRIAAAAAGLLIDSGVGAVNHRAVAAATGLSLGVVSHNCRRTDDLLRLAYDEIYCCLTGLSTIASPAEATEAPTVSGLPPRAQMLALDELMIAVARGRADCGFALQLRYLRGTTTRLALTARGEIDGADFDLTAAIFSSVTMGAMRALVHLPEEAVQQAIESLTERCLALVKSDR